MWHDVPFACQRRPIVGVLRMCWLLPGSFDCFCSPPPPPLQNRITGRHERCPPPPPSPGARPGHLLGWGRMGSGLTVNVKLLTTQTVIEQRCARRALVAVNVPLPRPHPRPTLGLQQHIHRRPPAQLPPPVPARHVPGRVWAWGCWRSAPPRGNARPSGGAGRCSSD